MPSLKDQRAVRAVQKLSFCYICGKEFADQDVSDRDHVPPEAVFAKAHRQPLILRTHAACNNGNNLIDEKMGQLVGLRRGYVTPDPRNRQLDVVFDRRRATCRTGEC